MEFRWNEGNVEHLARHGTAWSRRRLRTSSYRRNALSPYAAAMTAGSFGGPPTMDGFCRWFLLSTMMPPFTLSTPAP